VEVIEGMHAKAQAELEQVKVEDARAIAQTIGLVLNKFGKAKDDGSVVLEGNALRFSSSSSKMSVQDIKSGAIVFHIKDGQLLKHYFRLSREKPRVVPVLRSTSGGCHANETP
jgi:hypothetical protein